MLRTFVQLKTVEYNIGVSFCCPSSNGHNFTHLLTLSCREEQKIDRVTWLVASIIMVTSSASSLTTTTRDPGFFRGA